MSRTFSDTTASCPLPRRNARSLDLDVSATKAAAWVWHLHSSSKPGASTTEGQFISAQTKRRNSGSYDLKVSRFHQEASTTTKETAQYSLGLKADAPPWPIWDCGSKLYDTFELVAFSNSLDRSLMEVVLPASTPPAQAQPRQLRAVKSLRNPTAALGRRLQQSLPRSSSWQKSGKTSGTPSSRVGAMDKLELTQSSNNGGAAGTASIGPEKASTKGKSVAKFVSAWKKAEALCTQAIDVGCKRSTDVLEASQIRPITRKMEGSESTIRRELTLNPKIIGRLSATNRSDMEGMDHDRLSVESPSFSYGSISNNRSNYKLSIPNTDRDKLNLGRVRSDLAAMPRRIRAVSTDTVNSGYLSANQKIRSKSESFNGEHNVKIRSIGRKNGSAGADHGSRGRAAGASSEHEQQQQLDLHTHLHHHHHHHHHHHYIHHSLASEGASVRKEAMAHLHAEQKLANLPA